MSGPHVTAVIPPGGGQRSPGRTRVSTHTLRAMPALPHTPCGHPVPWEAAHSSRAERERHGSAWSSCLAFTDQRAASGRPTAHHGHLASGVLPPQRTQPLTWGGGLCKAASGPVSTDPVSPTETSQTTAPPCPQRTGHTQARRPMHRGQRGGSLHRPKRLGYPGFLLQPDRAPYSGQSKPNSTLFSVFPTECG